MNYELNITYEEAKLAGHVVALADSQMLRSIRDIRKHDVDTERIEKWFTLRDVLRKRLDKVKITSSSYRVLKYIRKHQYIQGYPRVRELMAKLADPGWSLRQQLEEVQAKIDRTMYVPDYVTIVMESQKHYEKMFLDGVTINGCLYRRLSCSAGQARVSTVVFCNTEIIEELMRRLNNGRRMDYRVAPSKFNAYFGLAGSSTFRVSEPRFIVVKDYENEDTFEANFVTETEYDMDDIVDRRTITMKMNRTDGMGLISPRQAAKWAGELGLDYIPSQFGVRQSFLKGMLCTFPFDEFCAEMNGGNYIVDTIYKDENGEYIKADLREVDIIISESQFKLWDAYPSMEEYIDNCRKNKLYWGVPQYSPKEPKDILKMNYMFLQTLKLNEDDIEGLASQFVDWLQGVSYDKIGYTLLFLLGINNSKERIQHFIEHSDSYWIKALALYPELLKDKYFRSKIHDLIKTKMQNGCMGQILVDGNFQTLVSDPYGFMQHVCGLPVTGLLGAGEFYSNYWNEKGVTRVDGMRSPLTFRSEHVIMDLVKNDQTEKWYRYCKQGIILNYHGHEVCNFGGADFDLDILATTSNPYIINGVYTDELTVTYEAPKPEKKIPTEIDLYHADLFSFGSIIGQITNKSSDAYALLPVLKERYGEDSEEYRLTYSRLKQCCKAQSAQIDKAKIGKEVKGIPKSWVNNSSKDEWNEYDLVCSRIRLNKYPYFFKYRYDECNAKLKNYQQKSNADCQLRFGYTVEELMDKPELNDEEAAFIEQYYKYMPVTISDSEVNVLCRYLEGINLQIKDEVKNAPGFDISVLKNNSVEYTAEQKEAVVAALKEYTGLYSAAQGLERPGQTTRMVMLSAYQSPVLKARIARVCPNTAAAVNCLVDYYYAENPKSSKETLWETYGRQLTANIVGNTGNRMMFPFPDPEGEIEYLGKKYSMQEVLFESV